MDMNFLEFRIEAVEKLYYTRGGSITSERKRKRGACIRWREGGGQILIEMDM